MKSALPLCDACASMAFTFGFASRSLDCIASGTARLSRWFHARSVWVDKPGGSVKSAVGSTAAGQLSLGQWTIVICRAPVYVAWLAISACRADSTSQNVA